MTPEPDDSARYWADTYGRRRGAASGPAPPPPAPASAGETRRPVAAIVAVAGWIVIIALQWSRLGTGTLIVLPLVGVHVAYILQGGRLRDAPIEAIRHFGKRFT